MCLHHGVWLDASPAQPLVLKQSIKEIGKTTCRIRVGPTQMLCWGRRWRQRWGCAWGDPLGGKQAFWGAAPPANQIGARSQLGRVDSHWSHWVRLGAGRRVVFLQWLCLGTEMKPNSPLLLFICNGTDFSMAAELLPKALPGGMRAAGLSSHM